MSSLLLALALLAAQSSPPPAPEKSDKDAAALLKKIEDKCVSAKTLHLKSKIDVDTGGQAMVFQCELWFGEGGRFRLTGAGNFGGMDMKSVVVSDGSKVRVEISENAPRTMDAPKGLAATLRTLAGRVGALTAMIMMEKPPADLVDDVIAAEGITAAPDEKVGEKTLKVLKYTLKAKDDNQPLGMKILIDPETLAVARREASAREDETMTEPSAVTTFDEELKAELFELPKDESKKDEPKKEEPKKEEPKKDEPPKDAPKEEPKK